MRGKAAVWSVLSILLCGGLWGQGRTPDENTSTRAVQGLVTAASGQPAAHAVLQLKNTKTLQIRSFITGADGRYHFAGLNGDTDYQLKAEHDGVSTSWKTISMFDTKKVVEINFKLKK